MMTDHISVLSKVDSYAERRKLFKNIWETAIQLDEKEPKEPDNGTKSKIIKTLRVNECNSGKSKKRRIKNLRTVCTKLLSFCDRQDAADLLCDKDQISAACEESNNNSAVILPPKEKRKKKHRKKKTAQTYSHLRPQDRHQAKDKTSFDLEVPDGTVTHRGTRPSRDLHSPIIERATLIQKFLNERYNIEKAPLPDPALENKLQVGDAPCKVVKKKKKKKKKVNPIPSPVSPPPRVKSPHTKVVHKRSSKRKKELEK